MVKKHILSDTMPALPALPFNCHNFILVRKTALRETIQPLYSSPSQLLMLQWRATVQDHGEEEASQMTSTRAQGTDNMV